MQNKGVKSVFKRNSFGSLVGQFPFLDFNEIDLCYNIKEIIEDSKADSVRVVVGNKVFEMHTDKHSNIIFRAYEK